MTTEQLDSIISHYKKKAIRAYNDDDTFVCNRMIEIVHDLEDNYDDYLDYEYEGDYLATYFDSIIPEASRSTSILFRTIDPYDNNDTSEVFEWMDDTDEFFDEDDDIF